MACLILKLDLIKQLKKDNKFAILKCTSDYPATFRPKFIIYPKLKRYKCPIGFSDHTIDDIASIIAVAFGHYSEKHFKMDNDDSSIDNHFHHQFQI